MKKFLFLFTLIPALLFASDYPKPQGPVNDFANVIDAQNKIKLTALSTELEKETGIALVTATLPSLNGADIETVAVKLFQDWGIGQKGIDKGILILAAIKDHNARIEVGYGLESVIPDAFAGRILREILFPYFKEGRYGDGFLAASLVLTETLSKKLNFQLKGIEAEPMETNGADFLPTPIKLIFFLIFIYLFLRHPLLFLMFFGRGGGGNLGGGFRGGSFGGGFGGFGGGLSGGGGASGRW